MNDYAAKCRRGVLIERVYYAKGRKAALNIGAASTME